MDYFIANISFNIAGKRIFKIGEHLAKLQAKWLIVSSEMQNSPDK